MASSATALVRSVVRRTVFLSWELGLYGDSRSTVSSLVSSQNEIGGILRPVLSKLLSARDSGYLQRIRIGIV